MCPGRVLPGNPNNQKQMVVPIWQVRSFTSLYTGRGCLVRYFHFDPNDFSRLGARLRLRCVKKELDLLMEALKNDVNMPICRSPQASIG